MTAQPAAQQTFALRIVEGAEAARAGVLRREPLGEPELPEVVRASIRETFGADLPAAEVVTRIVGDVRREGDAAVRRYSQRFDGSADAPMEVERSEVEAAFAEVPAELLESLRYAAERVRVFHELQLEHGPRSFLSEGLGQTVRPIGRAGIYMTGNLAVLPSSVIHTALPGAVAGVPERIGVTAARPDGSVHPLKLVAAALAGLQRVFRASGAQANRRARVRHGDDPAGRQAVRPRQRVRDAGQAAALRRGRHRRAVRADRDARARGRGGRAGPLRR